MTNDELIQEVLDRAQAYYTVLWSSCSRQERMVLVHLAGDGLVDGEEVGVTPLAGVSLGAGSHLFEARFPDVGFTWLEFGMGGEGVFMLTRAQLLASRDRFRAACDVG